MKALVAVSGLIAVVSVVWWFAEERDTAYNQSLFWREMYRQAEADAKYKKCVPLGADYAVCEVAK